MVVAAPTVEDTRARIAALPDPEIPILTLGDLGVIRDVVVDGDAVRVGVAPTYTSCPATEYIETSVRRELEQSGFRRIEVERRLSPPWTTDWISTEGRRKLEAYGIAPPSGRAGVGGEDRPVACPRCGATATTRVSEFGSTPCKAAYTCDACLEPFEYFKCL